ncbi:MAG TPA: Rieske 2Fe-2S domain-containing protein [Bryobacteraceae bacterium]|nr:Rieske 2Fe-2S domain-containing protein [Bryobacteraceae bacterium]
MKLSKPTSTENGAGGAGFNARPSPPEPLWRDEFSIFSADEKYVYRRQFTKFLVLTSFGMFVGNLWILVRSWFYEEPSYPMRAIARAGEIPVGGVKIFQYPGEHDNCILVRTGQDEYVAYSQKCTHLSCAVYYAREANRLECPCHEGYFSIRDGSVLQGPPPRPLPRVVLDRRGDELIATGIEMKPEA